MTVRPLSRRHLLAMALALAAAPALAGRRRALAATPSCGEGPTPPQTEGPFYTPDSPRRSVLVEPGMDGRPLVLEGRVLDTNCRPLAGTVVDLWHADAEGAYDNEGYRLRGHQFTDAEGCYRFETIVPGNYGWRTRHYHLKVAPPAGRVLTTQLYFPGEPRNARDGLFDPTLLLRMAEGGRIGRYDIVLRV